MKQIVFLILILFISNCNLFQGNLLDNVRYPETPFHSGFQPGVSGLNQEYSKEWCLKFCPKLKEVVESSSEEVYLEIRGKMDATELPVNRAKISLGRAESVRQLLLSYGILETKMRAIADPDPDEYLGKDKFDPENRVVRFKLQRIEKNK